MNAATESWLVRWMESSHGSLNRRDWDWVPAKLEATGALITLRVSALGRMPDRMVFIVF